MTVESAQRPPQGLVHRHERVEPALTSGDEGSHDLVKVLPPGTLSSSEVVDPASRNTQTHLDVSHSPDWSLAVDSEGSGLLVGDDSAFILRDISSFSNAQNGASTKLWQKDNVPSIAQPEDLVTYGAHIMGGLARSPAPKRPQSQHSDSTHPIVTTQATSSTMPTPTTLFCGNDYGYLAMTPSPLSITHNGKIPKVQPRAAPPKLWAEHGETERNRMIKYEEKAKQKGRVPRKAPEKSKIDDFLGKKYDGSELTRELAREYHASLGNKGHGSGDGKRTLEGPMRTPNQVVFADTAGLDPVAVARKRPRYERTRGYKTEQARKRSYMPNMGDLLGGFTAHTDANAYGNSALQGQSPVLPAKSVVRDGPFQSPPIITPLTPIRPREQQPKEALPTATVDPYQQSVDTLIMERLNQFDRNLQTVGDMRQYIMRTLQDFAREFRVLNTSRLAHDEKVRGVEIRLQQKLDHQETRLERLERALERKEKTPELPGSPFLETGSEFQGFGEEGIALIGQFHGHSSYGASEEYSSSDDH